MQTQTVTARPLIHESALMFSMNSRLFLNALSGISEEQAKERISDHNNPVNWLAAHTAGARYNICAMLGKPVLVNPYAGMFEKFKPFDASADYGSLAQSKEEWRKATALLEAALAEVTEEHLAAESPLKSPIGDHSFGGTITFLAHHETYQIGQIALLKKYLTNEAMSYY